MRYKCVDCDFTFERKGKRDIPNEAVDHLFIEEHHGFVKILSTKYSYVKSK